MWVNWDAYICENDKYPKMEKKYPLGFYTLNHVSSGCEKVCLTLQCDEMWNYSMKINKGILRREINYQSNTQNVSVYIPVEQIDF